MNRKMSDERLLRLADKLQGMGAYAEVGPVPKEKFNLNLFVNADEKPENCGFVACACGWAYFDPWFRQRKIQKYFEHWSGGPAWGNSRAAYFFGITEYDSSVLFHPCGYKAARPHPVTVAKKLRKLVKDRAG